MIISRQLHKYIIAGLSTLCISTSTGIAQTAGETAGTSSGLLLRFDPGARVAGLSGAFTALADDDEALYYNPAALSTLNTSMVSLNHSEWFEDIRIENLSFTYPLTSRIGLGAGITHMWLPDIQGYDESGIETEVVSVRSTIFVLGGSYSFNRYFSTGLNIKFLHDKLADYSATGFAGDIGIHGRFLKEKLLAGISVQNFGTELNYDAANQALPLIFRGGIAYLFGKPDIKVSLDILKSKDSDLQGALGVEYVYNDLIAIRAGNHYSSYKSFQPSFGLGIIIHDQYHLDYAFVNLPELSATHRIGISFYFNSPDQGIIPQALYDETTPVNLIPPTNIHASVDESELTISWSGVPRVQYNVYARHASQNEWIKLNKAPVYNNTIKFKRPSLSGLYHFRLTSVYGGRESSYSEEVVQNVK
jgi:hypothetical protein